MPLDNKGNLYTGHNIRVRSHDKMDSAEKTVEKRRQCRKTFKIDNCVFRCDQFHMKEDLTTHSESGILKRAGNPQDVHYTIQWQEKPAVTFRQQSERSKEILERYNSQMAELLKDPAELKKWKEEFDDGSTETPTNIVGLGRTATICDNE